MALTENTDNTEKKSKEIQGARPPRWAEWMLEKFGSEDVVDEIRGDLLEMFEEVNS